MTDYKKAFFGFTKEIIVCYLSLIIICLLIWAEWNLKKTLSTVVFDGVEYELTVSEIDLSGKDLSDQVDKLLKLTGLKNANLTDTGITPAQYDAIHAALPDCRIRWSVPVGGNYYPDDIAELALTPDIPKSELGNIQYLTHLKSVDASDYPLCDELYDATEPFRKPDSGCRCVFSGTLYGKPIHAKSKKFDFSSDSITDISEFYNVLRFFPNVKDIYLGDIAVPDEDVDRLNKAFPDTSIVWLVEFGRWQARTDIRVFSTLVGVGQRMTFDEKELYPLLAYCTELRALDLGHNHLSDITLIGKLTHLEVLIIAENKMDTLEPLANLKHLHALEVYNCPQINDLSPLGSCPELERLMINNDGSVKNIKALANCKKLNLLYTKLVNLDDYTWEELQQDLPGCTIDRGTYVTKGIWRNSPKGIAVRRAFRNWMTIRSYNHWDDFTVGTEEVGRKIK